jgi:hypothetical protein
MKNILIIIILFVVIPASSYAQKISLGDKLTPSSKDYKLLAVSSTTGVSTYHYIGVITDKYFYNRKVGDIIVGIKNGIVVTTIYNLIPERDDVGVPKSVIDSLQSILPYPLGHKNGVWGLNIDNESISVSRVTNPLTFNKDRIMFMSSVKQSLLTR